MRKHMAAEMGKLGQKAGTLSQKQDRWASPENCDFFWGTLLKIGTVPENPGHMVNRMHIRMLNICE